MVAKPLFRKQLFPNCKIEVNTAFCNSILQSKFRAIFVPFWGEKCDFLQVFVPRVLIFKKLHLLLHSKMEVQGEKCVENH